MNEDIKLKTNNSQDELQSLVNNEIGSKVEFDILKDSLIIGNIKFNYLQGIKSVMLSYNIKPEHRSKGYASIAVSEAIKILFDLGLNKISAFVEYDNTDYYVISSKILKKLGFIYNYEKNEGDTISFYELYNYKKEKVDVINKLI